METSYTKEQLQYFRDIAIKLPPDGVLIDIDELKNLSFDISGLSAEEIVLLVKQYYED